MSSSTHGGWGSDKSRSKQTTVHVVVTNNDPTTENDNDQDNESVGSILADIANAVNNTLRILMFADKTHWASDEFEQVRAVEDALDEAKRDFQELGPLVKGSFYYENDRRRTCHRPTVITPSFIAAALHNLVAHNQYLARMRERGPPSSVDY